jgi:hypothetical protein
MNIFNFWAIKVLCEEIQTNTQIILTDNYDLAIELMRKSYSDFIANLKNRTDINPEKITEITGLQNNQCNVTYYTDAGMIDDEQAYLLRYAYFVIEPMTIHLIQHINEASFRLSI